MKRLFGFLSLCLLALCASAQPFPQIGSAVGGNGGNATNAIGLNSGNGTNTSLWGVTAVQNLFGTGSGLTNLLGQGAYTVTPEQFGGAGDGVKLSDVTSTSGSGIVSSPSASFTAADVGKSVALYLDTTNAGVLVTTIASRQSATQVTLTANSTKSWAAVGVMRYGTENRTAISNALFTVNASGGGRIQFSNGCYMVTGVPSTNGWNEFSMLHVPATTIASAGGQITIELLGALQPLVAYNNQNGAASEVGTIIYCPSSLPTSGVNVTACYSLMGNNLLAAGAGSPNYPLQSTFFRNLTFRQTVRPTLSGLDWSHGGGLDVRDCSFDVDFPAGYVQTAQILTPFGVPMPQSSTTNDCSRAIICPVQANTAHTRLDRVHVFNYSVGIQANEHMDLHDSNIHWCIAGIEVGDPLNSNGAGNAAGCHAWGVQILGCWNDIKANLAGTVAGAQHVDFEAIYPEDYAHNTNQIYDPNSTIYGKIAILNSNFRAFRSDYLQLEDLWHGDFSVGQTMIGSPYGGGPIYAGLSFLAYQARTNFGNWYTYSSLMHDGTDLYINKALPATSHILFKDQTAGQGVLGGFSTNGGFFFGAQSAAGEAVGVGKVDATGGFAVAGAAGLTTNINALVAGSKTNQLQFTKGILTGVVPQ